MGPLSVTLTLFLTLISRSANASILDISEIVLHRPPKCIFSESAIDGECDGDYRVDYFAFNLCSLSNTKLRSTILATAKFFI